MQSRVNLVCFEIRLGVGGEPGSSHFKQTTSRLLSTPTDKPP